MIHSIHDPKGGGRKYKQNYYVSSDAVHKDATITKYDNCWQIKHVGNGARKNLNSYQECIDYLKSKGW